MVFLRLSSQDRTVTCRLRDLGLDWMVGAVLVSSDIMRIEIATARAH